MKIIKSILFFILFNISVSAQTVQIPELKSPVTDLTQTLDELEINQLENKLLNFEKENIGQIVILLIPTTGNETIEEYSIRLAEKWKIGSAENDDGVILLVAKNDRKLRIEVGYGLESKITDADAIMIIENIITPEFRNSNFYAGINNGTDAVINLIKGNPTPINTSDLYKILLNNTVEETEESSNEVSTLWFVIALILMTSTAFIPFIFLKKGILFYLILLIFIFGVNLLLGYTVNMIFFGLIYSVFSSFTVIIILIMKIVAYFWGKKTGNNPSSFFSGGSGSYSGWSSSSSSWSSSSGSSSSSSSYGGGGGSFGGGGASGSW